jgi:hypothetical protein
MSENISITGYGPSDAKESNYYKGILKYQGGSETLEKWDKAIQARLRHEGGKPWTNIWLNKFEPLTAANAKQIAAEIALARIDPTDAKKAFAELPDTFTTLASQQVIRQKIFEEIYYIARSATAGEAQNTIEGLSYEEANLIRDRIFALWGEKETADKQDLQKLFQAGITNVDKVTKFSDQEEQDVKLHVERLDHMQQRLREMTDPGDVASDSTLGSSALMNVTRTSLPHSYTATLAAYDSMQDFRREILGYINILLHELNKPQIPLGTEHQKFERLKKMVFNQYEAVHRDMLEKANKKEAQAELEDEKIPAFYISPNKNWSAEPCRQFQRGHCLFGDNCRFSHAQDKTMGAQQARVPFSEQTCTDCGQKGHQRNYYKCPKYTGPKDTSLMTNTGKRKRGQHQHEPEDKQPPQDETAQQMHEDLFNFIAKSACQ